MTHYGKGQDVDIPIVAPSVVTEIRSYSVQVTAPADLQEGYKFQVEVNGKSMTVRVPPGGVRQGDVFTAVPQFGGTDTRPNLDIPMNTWRDGLCDCCALGCCHPALCMGVWFSPILLGQVMTRMSRNFLGGAGSPPSTSNTCAIVTGIFLIFVVIEAVVSAVRNAEAGCAGSEWVIDSNTGLGAYRCPDGTTSAASSSSNGLNSALSTISFIYFVYMVVSTCMTRAAIRNKFNIEPKCCGACEDCCCAYWCTCCTVTQMARHTYDYRQRDVPCCAGACCNKTGQPEGTPYIV